MNPVISMTGSFLCHIHFPAMDRKWTFLAFGFSGGTDFPAKQDDPMTEIVALLRGQNLAELTFHLFRLLAFGQSQPSADADAVGVADNGSGLLMNIAQQEIRGFPPDAGDLQ